MCRRSAQWNRAWKSSTRKIGSNNWKCWYQNQLYTVIHGQQSFSVHTWLCILGMCIGGEYFWIVFRRVTRRHFLKIHCVTYSTDCCVVVAIQIPPSKTLGQIYTIGDRYTDRWRCSLLTTHCSLYFTWYD